MVKVCALDQGERYLGRKLCTGPYHEAECKNRFAAGWAAFMKFKGIFCNTFFPWKSRIKFFEAVVTPTVLYGCSAWTMTADSVRSLTTTRRRMLRCRKCRGETEGWVDFMRRSTHTSEIAAARAGARDWADLQYSRKGLIAGSLLRKEDQRWGTRLLDWKPWFRVSPHRRVGRPNTRWGDVFTDVAGRDWVEHAKDEALWSVLARRPQS